VFTESPGIAHVLRAGHSRDRRVAHTARRLVVTDNSWATPFGFPLVRSRRRRVVHAATKYIGGHSDVLSGLILANEATFPALHRLWTDIGVTASPDDCFLALRGFRTLPLRLARHTTARSRSRSG
jgi:cystathionine beta-lyase